MFHSIACFLTLEDKNAVQTADAKSRSKVYVFAGLILTITFLWTISTFLLSSLYLGLTVTLSIFAGLCVGTIVLFLERSIYHGGKGFWQFLFRIALGVVMAFLGSSILDTIIFSGDIDQQMRADLRLEQQLQTDSLEGVYALERQDKWQHVITAENHWKRLESEFVHEMEGSSPTGIVGKGDVATAKQELAEDAREAYLKEKAEFQEMELAQQQELALLVDRMEGDLSEYTLLTRFSALQKVIDNNRSAAKKIYKPLFYLLFFLEIIIVVLKFTYKETSLEYEKLIAEQIRRKNAYMRLRKMEQGMQIVASQPNGYRQAVQRYKNSSARVLS